MTKEGSVCCYIQEDKLLTPVMLIDNQLIEVIKDSKKHKPKILAALSKDLTFSITKTQILKNKKYKFSVQLKIKAKQTFNLFIDGKDDLQFFFKQFSEYGTATGLQQMIVSCQKVGEGSFAQVYKVITNYDSVMALKAFDKKSLKIHKNKMAYTNEIGIMRRLSSRYIASLGGLFQTEKNVYLKMEYFLLSLKHYIKKNISIKTQKKIMKQLLEALVQMKLKNVIHRDLKPENVMIRGKSESVMECVVIDFGLSTVADVEKYIFSRCGTPGFLAPQIANMSTKKDKLTPACDMFSLGCIFYRVYLFDNCSLTKKYLFSATNYNQVIDKNKLVQIPWDSFTLLAENERNLITKMLQKDPLQRISPEEALLHPYFMEQIDDEDEIALQECDLTKKMKSIIKGTTTRRQSISEIMSSFYSHSNGQMTEELTLTGMQKEKFKIKDSCISFQGPQKGSEDESRLRESRSISPHSRVNRRVSRFSQIKERSIL